MSSSPKKTINVIDPYHCEVTIHEGRFILEINSQKHHIRLHLKRWWISYLAKHFWKVIKSEEENIVEIKKTLRGG